MFEEHMACMGLVGVLLKHDRPAAGEGLFTAGTCPVFALLCAIV